MESIEKIANGANDQAVETKEIVDNFEKLAQAMNGITNAISNVNNLFNEPGLGLTTANCSRIL